MALDLRDLSRTLLLLAAVITVVFVVLVFVGAGGAGVDRWGYQGAGVLLPYVFYLVLGLVVVGLAALILERSANRRRPVEGWDIPP